MTLTTSEMTDWCKQLIEQDASFPDLAECLNEIPTLESLEHLPAGTRVLVRCDTDVKVNSDGIIKDDARLQSLLDTLGFCLEHNWIPIVYGHCGRDPELSLEPIANHLETLIQNLKGTSDVKVTFIDDWMSNETGEVLDSAGDIVSRLPDRSVVVLQNTRKYELERALWGESVDAIEENIEAITNYANSMRANFAEYHINEGFASSNRDLSSTVVPRAMKTSALGRYISRELKEHVVKTRDAELVIFSGIKIQKLDDLEQILKRGKVQMVIAAGSLALALRKAAANLENEEFSLGQAAAPGTPISISENRIKQAESMIQLGRSRGVEFVLPIDFILQDESESDTIPEGKAQMDIGPKSRERFEHYVERFLDYHRDKQTEERGPALAFHNGVFGKFEDEEFEGGTREFMLQLKKMHAEGVQVYVGGGEGGKALHQFGDESWVTHCFTAGGTILKALGSEPIPYLKALWYAAQSD